MAKYTLGALVAFVIIGATAFYIISKLNDGGAQSLTGVPVTILVNDRGPTESSFEFAVNQPTEIRIDNRTTFTRDLIYDGPEVEQLSNIKQPPPGGPEPPRLYIEAAPGRVASASVRFTKPGTYSMQLSVPAANSNFTIDAIVR